MNAFLTAVTLKALDGLTARSIVTAQNIANASTPRYRPLQASFETALAQAAEDGLQAVREVQPLVESARTTDGRPAELRLDMEMATASSTAMRYAALIEVLNRHMQLDGLAVARNT